MNGRKNNKPPLFKGAVPRRPLSLGYCSQNPGLTAMLMFSDLFYRLLPRREKPFSRDIRKVLIANWAHLGDALVAGSLVSLVQNSLPNVQVGFLAGSWSRAAIEGLANIRWLHTVDHWRLSRLPTSLRRKILRYLADRHKTLKEIRSIEYDAAIETYHFFPNSATLLWQAGIPRRIGYRSGGGGPLFTDTLRWTPAHRHLASYHRDLLAALEPAASIPMPVMPEFCVGPMRGRAIAGVDSPYVVVHMGAGNPLKEWPEKKWLELCSALADEGHSIVFTGKGQRESAIVSRVRRSLVSGINLCDRLQWREWLDLIRDAELLIGSDSAAGHMAAATNTPVVLICSGMSDDAQWRPLTNQVYIVRYPTACAPCYRSEGCSSMACVREVSVGEVLDCCRRALIHEVGFDRNESVSAEPSSEQRDGFLKC